MTWLLIAAVIGAVVLFLAGAINLVLRARAPRRGGEVDLTGVRPRRP